MFKEVGKEIKNRMKDYVFEKTALYATVGMMISLVLLALFFPEYFWVSIVVGVICAYIGYLRAREKAMMMYAYGELVDCVMELKKQICAGQQEDTIPSIEPPVREEVTMAFVKRDPSGGWTCPRCKKPNLARSAFCQHCGLEAEFE